MTIKKPFFRQQTKAEIKRKNLVETVSLADLVGLQTDQFVILQETLVPRGYESARKFMKHGYEVKLKRVYSLEQAIREGKTPVQLREQAFNDIDTRNYCGYSFLPLGRDRRKRKVSLVECLEGARIFAYAHQVSGAGIKVKAYSDSARVRLDGAEVVAEVPSRTKDEERIQLKLVSVPMIDCPEKYGVTLNIGSDHSCGSKRFNIRYKYTDDKESSGIVNSCCHEIAAYLELIQQQWQEMNIIPLQMSQFAIPSQETVDYYLKLENNVLVKDTNLLCEDKLRKPNRAEKEIGLWNFVLALGHDRTFYSRACRDGDVQAYRWR
ncbi:MAG: hypothetical protein NT076_02025 [Candidatus Pacearchaeota archaeon]|nr:hypothetical protein [Candidatus Pacearchaeota archaeon]